jgi:hypothetical protein
MATITRTTTTVTRTTTAVPVVRRSSARPWLLFLGYSLLALGILGLIPFVQDAMHAAAFHLEGGENAIHWVLGIATLVVAYAVRDRRWLAGITVAFGVAYLAVGLLGFIEPSVGAWHVGVGDNVLHLLLGVVTLLVGIAALNKERDASRVRTPTAPVA